MRLTSAILLVGMLCLSGNAHAGEAARITVQDLLRDLRSSDYDKAWAAARELGNFPQQKTQIVPALLAALKRDWPQCSGDIREAAEMSLAQLTGKEAVFPLLELIKRGKNIAHECAECGCCFLALTPGDVLTQREYDPFCENGILRVVNQWADFSHSKAMADLVTAGQWKPELLITIGKAALPRYAHFIAKHKDDPDVGVRIAVARGLGLIDNAPVAVPVLIHILGKGTEDFQVRWEASNALIAIGRKGKSPIVRGRLTDLAKEQDKSTAVLAARGATLLGEPRGTERLRALAIDAQPEVRQEALLALGEAADAGGRDVIAGRLQDENLAVRSVAMYALGRIGDASAVPLLERALEAGLRYQAELESRLKSGTKEDELRLQYGYGVFDLRQTHQEAVNDINNRKP